MWQRLFDLLGCFHRKPKQHEDQILKKQFASDEREGEREGKRKAKGN